MNRRRISAVSIGAALCYVSTGRRVLDLAGSVGSEPQLVAQLRLPLDHAGAHLGTEGTRADLPGCHPGADAVRRERLGGPARLDQAVDTRSGAGREPQGSAHG